MEALIIWLTAYILGSIPCGVVIARMRNVDIREHGSGNIGATNVARVLGKKEGIVTLLGDCAKGCIAAAAAAAFLEDQRQIAIAGFLALAGHVFSVFLKFKGGKGVATGLGVFVYLLPQATAAAVATFGIALLISGYVSAGSILAALALPLAGLALHAPAPYVYAAAAAAVLIIGKHAGNIRRLLAGTESRFLSK